MKTYSDKISISKNSRGIYCLDTTMGCQSGTNINPNGCYDDCYAAKSAKTYGYDFGNTVLRRFYGVKHKRSIIKKINNSSLNFIRIGCSGDPSENWAHTASVINEISNCNKEIIIITKHWNNLTEEQLIFFSKLNVCINTSVSALDMDVELENRLLQYNRIKKYCKSILRIVSCDFNTETELGFNFNKIQNELFKNENIIDTVFRPSRKNSLVSGGIIKTSIGVFNGNKQLMSKFNRKTFTGKCASCIEMCGASMLNGEYSPDKKIVNQLQLWNKLKNKW